MIIDYQVIPHSQQRYDTVGDWWFESQPNDDGGEYEGKPGRDYDEGEGGHRLILHIRVSRLSDPRYELLVFHHELTEALLCREKGVTTDMVDEWDKEYEGARCLNTLRKPYQVIHEKMGDHEGECRHRAPCGCEITPTSEPGHDMHAPYYSMHCYASLLERKLAQALQVDWKAYSEELEAL